MNTKSRIERTFNKKGIPVTWQKLKFGFERAVIECKSEEEFEAAYETARKIRNVKCESWVCRQGEFEGYVYLMPQQDAAELTRLLEDERVTTEAWWQRYHSADSLTRRMMACGEIA